MAPPKVSTLGENVKGSEWGSEYFAEYVRQWLVKEFPSDVVYGGGLKVYTTLDLNMQKAAYDAVTQTLDRDGDPAASVVSIDDAGQVKAMMGGTDFANNKVNLATGKAGGGSGRQPGSTFKMFALAEAVRQGYSIQSVLPAPSKIEITDPICLNGEDKWSVRGGPGGAASLVSATKNSINTTTRSSWCGWAPTRCSRWRGTWAWPSPASSPSAPWCSAAGRCRCSTWPPATPRSPTTGWPRAPSWSPASSSPTAG